MEGSPSHRVMKLTGLVLAGMVLGIVFGLNILIVSFGHHTMFDFVMNIVLGVSILILIAGWKVAGTRPVGIALASAVGTVACSFLAIWILCLMNPPVSIRPPPSPSYEEVVSDAPIFLKKCATDELRMVEFGQRENYSTESVGTTIVNLTTGSFELMGTGHYRAMGLSSAYPPFHPYHQDVLAKIKTKIASLPTPAPKSFFRWESYQDEVHIAFYQNGQLRIYDYSKGEAKSQLYVLNYILDYSPNTRD